MKQSEKLAIKKVTLRDLDEPTLPGMAGGTSDVTCHPKATCCEANCICTGGICQTTI